MNNQKREYSLGFGPMLIILILACLLGGCASTPKMEAVGAGSPHKDDYSPWTFCYRWAGAGDLENLKKNWTTQCHAAQASGSVTLMMVAAIKNQVNVMEWLLGKGFDVNQPSDIGDTPINFASVGGSREALLWLLDHNADPHSHRKDGITGLMQLIYAGNSSIAIEAINHNFPVNDVDSQGWPPLFFAVRQRQIDVVKDLVKHGANIEHTSNTKETAFSLALESNWKEGSEYLLSLSGR